MFFITTTERKIVPEIPNVLPAYRPQPDGGAWPTTSWPTGPAIPAVDAVVSEAFDLDELATTNAVVVIHGGRVIAERYFGAKEYFDRPAEPIDETSPLISWSMAKSMTHFLVGTLVDQGRLDPDARANVPEWADPSDPRHEIRLRDLLAMRDGLDYVEDYVDDGVSHVIDMLFGAGKDDVAGYTAARPLQHVPDTVFNYSSGTTNIISRIVAEEVGYGADFDAYFHRSLLDPVGMTSAYATYDATGVFVGSSYVHATARDFAKFGLLYLRGGEWDGHRLVSQSWTDTAQVPLSADEEAGTFYSWQWWVTGDEFGTYWASGYDGQMISVVPALDAVLVRLGRTGADHYADLRAWRHRVLTALAENLA